MLFQAPKQEGSPWGLQTLWGKVSVGPQPFKRLSMGSPSLCGISIGLQHFQGGQSAVNRPLEGVSIGTPSPWRVLYEVSRSLEGSTWGP